MHKWIRKLHMYTGLLNFTILVVFGVVGLSATFLPPPAQRPQPEREVRHFDFKAPGQLDDRQLADRVFQRLALPFTRPTDRAINRDGDHNLTLSFWTPGKTFQTQ